MAPVVDGYCKIRKSSILPYILVFVDLAVGLASCTYLLLLYLSFVSLYDFPQFYCQFLLSLTDKSCPWMHIQRSYNKERSHSIQGQLFLMNSCRQGASYSFTWRWKHQLSKMLFSLEYQMMVEVQKLSNPKHIKSLSFTEQIQTYSSFCKLYNIYRNIWQVLLFLNKSILKQTTDNVRSKPGITKQCLGQDTHQRLQWWELNRDIHSGHSMALKIV